MRIKLLFSTAILSILALIAGYNFNKTQEEGLRGNEASRSKSISKTHDVKTMIQSTQERVPASINIELKETLKRIQNSKENQRLKRFVDPITHKKMYDALSISVIDDDVKMTPELSRHLKKEMNTILKNKDTALNFINDALSKLPARSVPDHRLSVLVLMSYAVDKFPENSEFIEIAEKELVENPSSDRPSADKAQSQEELNKALSTDSRQVIPQLTHEIVLNNSTPQKSLEITVDAIASQSDGGVQLQLYENFLGKYPQEASTLNNELVVYDIDLQSTLDEQSFQASNQFIENNSEESLRQIEEN